MGRPSLSLPDVSAAVGVRDVARLALDAAGDGRGGAVGGGGGTRAVGGGAVGGVVVVVALEGKAGEEAAACADEE